MRCTACGVTIHAGDDFCRRCGSRVAGPPEVRATESAALATGQAAAHDEAEITLWSGLYSWKGMAAAWFGAAAFTVAAPVAAHTLDPSATRHYVWPCVGAVWGVCLAWLFYRKRTVAYVLTTQRLISQWGLFRRRVRAVDLIDIDGWRYEQGIFERMLGAGRVAVTTNDRSETAVELVGISRNDPLFEQLNRACRAERLKHGLESM